MAGSFIGQKLVVNEFVAYLNFAPYLKDEVLINGVAMSDHTKAIISFALCGFANLSSVAILLGGLGSMAPNRRGTIAKFGLKAVLAGSVQPDVCDHRRLLPGAVRHVISPDCREDERHSEKLWRSRLGR